MTDVVIPERNRADIDDVPQHVRDDGRQLDVVCGALTLSDQHAAAGDDDQIVDRDGALGGIDLLERIDVLGEPDDPGEVGRLQPARGDVAGAHRILDEEAEQQQRYRTHVNLWTRFPS